MSSPSATLPAWRAFFRQAAKPLAANWQRAPVVFAQNNGLIRDAITLPTISDLVDTGKLPVGCASLSRSSSSSSGSWTSQPIRGSLVDMLEKSTVYANNAGMYSPILAQVCLGGVESLGWPITCNTYMSSSGKTVSVPPHTDRQDVLVLQTQGSKRWAIYAPPAVEDGKDALRRGKDGDEFSWEALGDPLLEVTLNAGDALYCPLGFPHTTTTEGDFVTDPHSVHITVNVDSVIWGLSYRMLWAAAVQMTQLAENLPDGSQNEAIDSLQPWEDYTRLQAPLPMGFLGVPDPSVDDGSEDGVGHSLEVSLDDLKGRAAKWGFKETVSQKGLDCAIMLLQQHRMAMLQLHRQMYMDVLLDLSNLPPLEKEMGHYSLLEAEMRSLRQKMGWEE